MGRETFSRSTYITAKETHTLSGKSSTFRGEQTVKETGKLAALVDPAEYGVVRESRIRLKERPDGLFEVTVGTPIPTEYRLDTTGSMGDNVDRALKALPSICELTTAVLPGRDPHYCASIFGDVVDRFVLCRGQFEMLAERMVDQLTLMHPEGNGGDPTEDPQYGLFGAAYLTRAYAQRIGMKSFDFTITDAPGRDSLLLDQLKRVYGPTVLDKAKENGHEIDDRHLPTTYDVAQDLKKRAHAFALLVGTDALSYWIKLYGKDRVVILPRIEHLPHAMATIIGLSEGTLDLQSSMDFLTSNNLRKADARTVVDAVSGIPLNAQRILPNFKRMPNKGDLFAAKTDLWPIDPSEAVAKVNPSDPVSDDDDDDGGWL